MPHPYLLKMTKPTDPADKFIEEGLLSLISSVRPPRLGPLAAFSCNESVQSLESVQASITAGKCFVRFLIHFIKGCAAGTGMYVADYMLVNGHFGKLVDAISDFINGNNSSGDIQLLPSA